MRENLPLSATTPTSEANTDGMLNETYLLNLMLSK